MTLAERYVDAVNASLASYCTSSCTGHTNAIVHMHSSLTVQTPTKSNQQSQTPSMYSYNVVRMYKHV